MNIVQTIILGMIEGLTEFLPISSTFHLIFGGWWLGIIDVELVKVFEVFIQAGAILAVVALYGREVLSNRQLSEKLLVSFIPTGIVGLALHKTIKGVFFESEILMLAAFMGLGIVFIIYEKWLRNKIENLKLNMSQLTYQQAVLIGMFQALAVIPGVSRAGAVILGMMFLKFKRSEAAKYSFLLAVPTICAAAALDFFSFRQEIFAANDNLMILGLGFGVAMVSAYLVLKWFIEYIQKNSLAIFGWYRLVVGGLLAFWLMGRG